MTNLFLRHRNMGRAGEPRGCSLRGSALFLLPTSLSLR
jgi:hypothetical protein